MFNASLNIFIRGMINLLVRYLSSNYHHNSSKRENSVKLGKTNKQYVTVRNTGTPKLGLLRGLGRNPNPIKADFCCCG